jgi:hypothetical protein
MVGDNASNNDRLALHLATCLAGSGCLFSGKAYRIRCFAHVLNLAMQVSLDDIRSIITLTHSRLGIPRAISPI